MRCNAWHRTAPRQVWVVSADAQTSSVAGSEQSPTVADTVIAAEAAVGTQEMVQGDSVSNDLLYFAKFVGQDQ